MEQHKILIPAHLKGLTLWTDRPIKLEPEMSKNDYIIAKEYYPELCIIEEKKEEDKPKKVKK